MADFGDDEWPHMLCIETANVAANAVNLAAGATHEMWAVIEAAR
jgi:glucose-6-phosphate 1-epimerase